MFYKHLPIYILIIALIFSCREATIINFSESNISTKNNTIVYINVPLASSSNKEISKRINDTIKNFISHTLALGDTDLLPNLKALNDQITIFNKEYDNFIKDFPESQQKWEAQIDGEVLLNSNQIISIAITSYINTGGAHGSTNISFLNFDASNGNSISTNVLLKDVDNFTSVAKRYFDASVQNKSILFEPDVFKLPQNIAYSEEGLILLYNPYEIAPYSSGIIEFTIPYKEINPFLTFDHL